MGRAWCGEMPSLSRYGDVDQGCARCPAMYRVVTFGTPAMFCGGVCRVHGAAGAAAVFVSVLVPTIIPEHVGPAPLSSWTLGYLILPIQPAVMDL